MSVEPIDHTADVGVRITASTLNQLFVEAAEALTATLTEPARVRATETRRVTVQAADLDQLLVEWLTELVAWFDIERFLAATTTVEVRRQGRGWQCEAEVAGERFDGARHPLRVLVKGVTYHDLRIGRSASGGWQTDLVLDV